MNMPEKKNSLAYVVDNHFSAWSKHMHAVCIHSVTIAIHNQIYWDMLGAARRHILSVSNAQTSSLIDLVCKLRNLKP